MADSVCFNCNWGPCLASEFDKDFSTRTDIPIRSSCPNELGQMTAWYPASDALCEDCLKYKAARKTMDDLFTEKIKTHYITEKL